MLPFPKSHFGKTANGSNKTEQYCKVEIQCRTGAKFMSIQNSIIRNANTVDTPKKQKD